MKTKEDEERFTAIFDSYCHVLFRHIYVQIGGDREAAKDILNEVWEVLIQKFDTIGYDDNYLKSWLFAVASNKVKNYKRKKYRYYEIPCAQAELLRLSGAIRGMEPAEFMAIEEYIKSLRPIEQLVLLERVKGCSYRELSRRLDRSEQALQCLHSRTVKKLQIMMNQEPDWC